MQQDQLGSNGKVTKETMKNKHGLSRDIPADASAAVRRRCGFGCVVCGAALYDYDHFAPEFKDARMHDPGGIALLCPNHHRAKDSGTLTKAEYLDAVAKPAALNAGWARTDFSSTPFAPQFVIGGVMYNVGTSIMQVDDEMVLGFRPPEAPGAPPRLVARILEEDGTPVFVVEDNEIKVNAAAFDVQSSGPRWLIRSQDGRNLVEFVLELPYRIRLPRMRLRYMEWTLVTQGGNVVLERRGAIAAEFPANTFVSGPCFVRCNSATGEAIFEGLTFEGNAGTPPPLGSQSTNLPKGLVVFKFPVYVFMTGESTTPVRDTRVAGVLGTNIMPMFTNEKLAASAQVQPGYRIQKLGSKGLRHLLADVAVPQGIEGVFIDPDPKAERQVLKSVDIKDAIDSLDKYDDEDVVKLLREEQAPAPPDE